MTGGHNKTGKADRIAKKFAANISYIIGNEVSIHTPSLGLPRVLEYSSTTRVVNYSSNVLLLEYSLISISGCKFPFPVQFLQCRLQSIDELLEFMETWGFTISFATCQPVPSMPLIKYEVKNHACSRPWPLRPKYGDPCGSPTTPYSSLAACIKVLLVLTSTRVLVKVLGRVLE